MPPQKHIIEQDNLGVASATQTSLILAKGVINPDPFSDATQCRAGAIIGAITLQIDVAINATAVVQAPQQFDWFLFFNINDAQTPPTANNIMGSAGADLLQQVFHQDGCMITAPNSASTSDASTHAWRTQITIPRAWSKIMRGDTIRLYFKFGSATQTYIKIRAIYKEYFP